MKNILILTAFALGSLAAAQTAPAPAPAPAPADTTPAPADTTPAPADTTPAPADVAPAPAPTDAAPADATPVSAPMPTMNMDSMNPADHFARAQELAVQADVAYPAAFYDRTLWKASVDQAYLAASSNGDRAYSAYLAQLYTKTQWWINAYNAWSKLGTLSDTEKQWASLSAAKLAYIALQRGDKQSASAYVQAGMAWADSPSLQAIKSRL